VHTLHEGNPEACWTRGGNFAVSEAGIMR
jgi:hypothetical protein